MTQLNFNNVKKFYDEQFQKNIYIFNSDYHAKYLVDGQKTQHNCSIFVAQVFRNQVLWRKF